MVPLRGASLDLNGAHFGEFDESEKVQIRLIQIKCVQYLNAPEFVCYFGEADIMAPDVFPSFNSSQINS